MLSDASTKIRRLAIAGLCASTLLCAAGPAQAATFVLNDVGGRVAGTPAERGFRAAAAFWSSVLTNDVTIRLDIDFRSLAPGVLGSTGSNSGSLLVQNAYYGLATTGNSALDAQAVANLSPLGASQFGPGIYALTPVTSAYVDPVNRIGVDTTKTWLDNDGGANNVVLDVNTANMRALGFDFDDDGNDLTNVTDGSITFSSDFAFDFDPTDGITPGSFDFIGVAIHEIGHALGFVSGIDTYDVVGRDNGPLSGPFEAGAFGTADIGEFRVFSMLDLFRYSADGVLDLSVGTDSYFSLDGGASQLFGNSLFSTGAYNGNGDQASHWLDSNYFVGTPGCPIGDTPLGIMDPTFAPCEAGAIRALDLAAFDAMGWNINFDVLANSGYRYTTAQAYAAIPEPMLWAQLILGFGLLGGALRRVRARKLSVTFG